MAGDAPNVINDSATGTAAVLSLTGRHKQVAVRNTHATQTLTVKLFTGNTSAAAAAAAAATPAVIGADDVYTIPAGVRTVIMKSGRRTFCSFSVIASGAGTGLTIEGTDWTD